MRPDSINEQIYDRYALEEFAEPEDTLTIERVPAELIDELHHALDYATNDGENALAILAMGGGDASRYTAHQLLPAYRRLAALTAQLLERVD